MKNSRRYLAMLIVLGLLLLLTVLLFEPFVMDKILVPLAAAIWLLLRIFVLSIDQIYYWIGLSGVGFTIVIFRTIHHLIYRPGPVRLDSAPDASLALMAAESWRNRIELAAGGRARAVLPQTRAGVGAGFDVHLQEFGQRSILRFTNL